MELFNLYRVVYSLRGITIFQLLQALFNNLSKDICGLVRAKGLIYGRYMHKQAAFAIHIQGVQIDITTEKPTHIFGCLRSIQRLLGVYIIWSHAIRACCIYSSHNLINI